MKQWTARAGVALFLLVALAAAVYAYQSMRSTLEPAAQSTPSASACSPMPCVDEQGFTLWVSNLNVQGNLVRMTVNFKNSSSATHASPDDLSLIDRANHTSQITTTGADCNTWSRHEFAHGQTFGPLDICFQVTDSAPPFTLRWTPDMGFFCCETELTLGLS